MSIEPWNTGTDGAADCEDMPRKSIDRKFTDDPLREKRGNCTLFCLPARTGLGRARSWVKGWIPCGFLGQRPKPSESFSSSISTVFKVLLSLFFHGSFFIDYLTLPFHNRRISLYQFHIKVVIVADFFIFHIIDQNFSRSLSHPGDRLGHRRQLRCHQFA